MIRTQIQLPDLLYKKLKEISESQEISLAELLRRGAEYIISISPEFRETKSNWKPPKPVALGKFLIDVKDWRDLANQR